MEHHGHLVDLPVQGDEKDVELHGNLVDLPVQGDEKDVEYVPRTSIADLPVEGDEKDVEYHGHFTDEDDVVEVAEVLVNAGDDPFMLVVQGLYVGTLAQNYA